jgi:molybdopterin molybdotransferase
MTTALLGVREAQARVLAAAPRLGSDHIAVSKALDRVLAEDLNAATDVPPFACSAMDGYAIEAGGAGRTLELVGESRAGSPSNHTLGVGEAIRISTGAAVPAGATAVIRQEDVTVQGGTIQTGSQTPAGANIREAGEDMRAGVTVLRAGTRIGAAELGAAVAAGAGSIAVARRPRVAVLCTGDELRAAGEPLGPGEIHNSNGPMLAALAERCGGVAELPQLLPDDRAATETGLASALRDAEVVIVAGGVSVGPHDHVKPALAHLGVAEQFWGVALQPGKPTWFGTKGEKLVFGLPGNPVSAAVTFVLFAWPAIAALQGARFDNHSPGTAALGVAVRRKALREQALRVRLEQDAGRTVALPNGPQGSHILTSLLGADALALIPAGEGELPAGTEVELERLPD